MAKTSNDYKPCVAVWPNGQKRRCNVLTIRLDDADSARRKLADGQVAWVAPEDVERVTSGGQD